MNFIFEKCRNVFLKKLEDYNLSWIFLKKSSIIDQILIKSIRIKNIQSSKYQLIKEEKIIETYMDIINYIIIVLIKSNIKSCDNITHSEIIDIYDENFINVKKLLNFSKKKFYSINNVLYNISYLKNKKESYKKFKEIIFDMLINIICLLKHSILKKNENK